MAMLMLTCKKCGKDFPSGIDAPKGAIQMENNTHGCPHCGAAEKYNTPDYH